MTWRCRAALTISYDHGPCNNGAATPYCRAFYIGKGGRKLSLIKLIASRNYISVNKDLIKLFGLEEAVILGELASEYAYWEDRGELAADGYFYSTVENIEKNTTIKEKRQRAALKKLHEAGVVSVVLRGLPAKRYFRIHAEVLAPILLNNNGGEGGATSAQEAELDLPDGLGNKNKSNKISNKNKEINIIVDFLNSCAGTSYRATSKATQGHINARLAEGFKVEDFKAVISKKCAEWKGGEMEKYLRPETLFGSKFENYLNAPAVRRRAYGETGVEIAPQQEADILDGIL